MMPGVKGRNGETIESDTGDKPTRSADKNVNAELLQWASGELTEPLSVDEPIGVSQWFAAYRVYRH